ncbi:PREDICTED: centrosomal protein of 162 kDa [Papilio polytes]|uniref:centrosomal protein of 162 kDa n=1 Tax=Papilio polytes TaxID=76194 RepID=UPI000675E5B1|nr:PREDICTED: centrosomal protein of 162 kDa [Papilio polytes]
MANNSLASNGPTSEDILNEEFLLIEKSCESKDSDDEIRNILNELKRLSTVKNKDTEIGEDVEDVDMILKRAEDIAHETKNLLNSSPVISIPNGVSYNTIDKVPQIKVTKHVTNENKIETDHKITGHQKENEAIKVNVKENTENRRKTKRPLSAGFVDCKKKEVCKVKTTNSPKRSLCRHENIIEELKDTNERVKSLELLNVQLTEDNKLFRKKLDQINNDKHIAELKVNECEKFIHKLSKEYENKNSELKSLKDCETHIRAELNKERNERKSLTTQHEKDIIVINDLQRQVKEMEMILKRKHPDSVSALIVASKSSTVEDNKKKLLEERIARLEQELKDKENHFQSILVTLQEKFSDMKNKYESHIIDVERQLMEDRKVNTDLKNKVNKTNLKDSSVQTVAVNRHAAGTQTFSKPDRASSAVSRISQNSTLFLNKLKEDSYLIATIKGLQSELTVKQRTISKINRETEELKKNLRNLQKEKEVLANLHPQKRTPCKQAKSVENILAKVTNEFEMELAEARKQKEVLSQEKSSLLDSLKRTNEEFILLKKKRIQDLHTLQLAHEKELMQMNMQLYPLQEEIKLLNRTVEILQERARAADEKLRCNGKREIDVRAGGDNPTSNHKR